MATDIRAACGSCLCGKVHYEARGDPVRSLVCHCINCRKATGAAFMANAVFPAKRFTITRGQEYIRWFEDADTDSKIPIKRHFCSTCGSNIYMQSIDEKRGRYIVVHTGTIDEAPSTDAHRQGWNGPTEELKPEQRRSWLAVHLTSKL